MRRILYTPGTISRVAIVLALLLSAACDDGNGPVPPSATGTIAGNVTINGSGAAGIVVTASNGQTTTTSATGAYTLSNVPEGAYTVSISGYPSDVTFPATVQAAVVATSGQVVAVNFAGTRVAPPQTEATVAGTLALIGGDASHDPFVFNAGGGIPASVHVTVVNGTSVTIAGVSGFAPSSLPTLAGTVDPASGTGTASGSGTIAGRSNVSVNATGTLAGGGLEVELVVGGQGELPGGQPVRYRFAASE